MSDFPSHYTLVCECSYNNVPTCKAGSAPLVFYLLQCLPTHCLKWIDSGLQSAGYTLTLIRLGMTDPRLLRAPGCFIILTHCHGSATYKCRASLSEGANFNARWNIAGSLSDGVSLPVS